VASTVQERVEWLAGAASMDIEKLHTTTFEEQKKNRSFETISTTTAKPKSHPRLTKTQMFGNSSRKEGIEPQMSLGPSFLCSIPQCEGKIKKKLLRGESENEGDLCGKFRQIGKVIH